MPDTKVRSEEVSSEPEQLDQRCRDEQLAHVLQTVGTLCHQVNNPLTTLLGRAQMLGMHASDDPYVKNASAVIEESSRRLAETIKELAETIREAQRQTEA
jgi:signal transduction histidine kinase